MFEEMQYYESTAGDVVRGNGREHLIDFVIVTVYNAIKYLFNSFSIKEMSWRSDKI